MFNKVSSVALRPLLKGSFLRLTPFPKIQPASVFLGQKKVTLWWKHKTKKEKKKRKRGRDRKKTAVSVGYSATVSFPTCKGIPVFYYSNSPWWRYLEIDSQIPSVRKSGAKI